MARRKIERVPVSDAELDAAATVTVADARAALAVWRAAVEPAGEALLDARAADDGR